MAGDLQPVIIKKATRLPHRGRHDDLAGIRCRKRDSERHKECDGQVVFEDIVPGIAGFRGKGFHCGTAGAVWLTDLWAWTTIGQQAVCGAVVLQLKLHALV